VLDVATLVFLDRGYGGATVRAVAVEAGVSVPTVEALFGTKARLLKAAIDIAIAGDDEPVPVLDRPPALAASKAANLSDFLCAVTELIAAAQRRSAGLVLAVFEGSSRDADLEALMDQMVAQREATAAWVVRGMTRLAQLRPGCTLDEAVDVVWLLMDPALFVRLTRQRQWSAARYRGWLADALERLLVTDVPVLRRRDADE
jgi:AcrR family transcriptional regulator